MISSVPPHGVLAVVRALAIGFACYVGSFSPALASGPDYLIADDDGYGIAECMMPGAACGRVMADAWCEAHGRGRAEAFGPADDMTGSTKVSVAAADGLASAVVIRCRP